MAKVALLNQKAENVGEIELNDAVFEEVDKRVDSKIREFEETKNKKLEARGYELEAFNSYSHCVQSFSLICSTAFRTASSFFLLITSVADGVSIIAKSRTPTVAIR